MFLPFEPRALPWAITFGPVGAGHRRNAAARHPRRNAAGWESPGCNPGSIAPNNSSALKGPDIMCHRFAESAKREQAIQANLRGVVYGG
jgi:hypothetical protein